MTPMRPSPPEPRLSPVSDPGVSGGPPPGWYPDPTGTMRWWDGARWTAASGPVPGGGNTKTLALVANLGGIVGGWLVPLIVYLVDGGKDRFVRHHASEALNFQLTLLIVNLILFIPYFGSFFFLPFAASGSSSTGLGAGAGAFFGVFILVFVGIFVLFGLNLAFSIMGMVRANRGEWGRYPFRIRFVKGFCPPEERYAVQ